VTHIKKAMLDYVSHRKITATIVESSVAARGRLDVPMEVPAGGREYAYSFSTAKNDIQFSVEFIPASVGPSPPSTPAPSKGGKDEIKATVLLEAARITATADAPHSGVIAVPAAGTVRFVFDNSHSRFSAKTVFHSISALPAPSAADIEPPLPADADIGDAKEEPTPAPLVAAT